MTRKFKITRNGTSDVQLSETTSVAAYAMERFGSNPEALLADYGIQLEMLPDDNVHAAFAALAQSVAKATGA